MDTSLFILAMCEILSIKKPVEIRVRTRAIKKHKGIAGLCENRVRKGKTISYVIFLNMREIVESNFTFLDVLAHEMVHIVQIENGIFQDKRHHDKTFQRICKVVEKESLKLGVKLGKLYSPKSDTT